MKIVSLSMMMFHDHDSDLRDDPFFHQPVAIEMRDCPVAVL